jgi:transcriptional regulator with XRE-family HTH domain
MKIDVGKLIRDHRKNNNLTQQELADKLDISYQLLQKYEYNKCRPSLEVLANICKILEIPIEKIFGDGYMKINKPDVNFTKKDIELIREIKEDKELRKLIKLYLVYKEKFRKIKVYDFINRIVNE